MRKAKIVCTVGPSSRSEVVIEALMTAGADVFRLNFSHGTQAEHAEAVRAIRRVSERLRRPAAILQDLQGPKIRIGRLPVEPVALKVGEAVTLTTRQAPPADALPTTYRNLPNDVAPGDRVLLDDGNMELRVLAVDGEDVRCEVVIGGGLRSHKGINLPGVRVSAPSLTPKDREDLAFGIAQGVDYVALSFVRHPADVKQVHDIVKAAGADIPVIAKLEREEAVAALESILEVSDGVMVARGDLGVELPPERVPVIQKQVISAANRAGVLVITATQMLESMTGSPRPTRAEASDVANAVFDGTDAVMLSGETAVGQYPVETVRMMARIVAVAEGGMSPPDRGRADMDAPLSFPDAVGHAAATAARDVQARAIVAFTQSGSTARLISKRRPLAPILAFTPDEAIFRRLCLCWGTQPRMMALATDTDGMVAEVEARLLMEGEAKVGDALVILSGTPIAARPPTNLLKLHRVSAGR